MNTDTLAFATALVASISLTPAVRQLAFRLNIVDKPGERKIHLNAMPLMGGVAMYIAALTSIILFTDSTSWSQIIAILGGATLLLIVGILDDCNLLHHQIKLLLAMPLAAITLILADVRFFLLEDIFRTTDYPTLLLIGDYLLTFFWVIGITAAFSILDHMDGLCAGVVAIASAFFSICAAISGQVLVGTLSASMFGAALGFLWWNFKPAKIFMGDGGAMFLGFMMAVLGIKLRFPEISMATSWMIPVLILGVVIFDTTLVTISRSMRGLVPFSSPGKDHTAHRLVCLGLSQRGAVLVLYGMGITFGILALFIRQLPVWSGYLLGGGVALLALLAIIALEHVPYERQRPKQRVAHGTPS